VVNIYSKDFEIVELEKVYTHGFWCFTTW